MVARSLRYILLAGFVLVLLLVAVAAWMLATEPGTRFSLAAVSRLSPLQIDAESVQGTLTGPLVLEQVEVAWPGGGASVEELRLVWQPGRLLRGHLQVDELLLRGVTTRSTAEAEESPADDRFDPGFPRPERIPALSATVEKLQIEDLILQRPGEEDRVIESFSARLGWDRPDAWVEDFLLVLPEVRLTGEARSDLSAPLLELDLQADLPEPVADIENGTLTLSLQPAAGERHLSGPVSLEVSGESLGELSGSGTLDWTADRLALEAFRLTLPEDAGEVEGRLVVTGEAPEFHIELKTEGIDLLTWLEMPTDLSGEVQISGTPAGFQGRLQLANEAEDWRGFRLAAPFSGSRSGISLPDLQGNWLAGTLQGEARANWQETAELQLQLQGKELDPARVTPDWPGRLQFSLNASAAIPAEGPAQAEVDGRLHDSRLRGEPLAGTVRASLAGEDLRIDELALKGEGIELFAQGRLRERIDFRAQVARLSVLIPEARGRLQAQGWGRWRDRHLSGRLEAEGSGLAAAGVQVERFRIEAGHERKGEAFRLQVEAAGVVRDDLHVASVVLQAQGMIADHTLRFTAAGPDLEVQAAARGGYRDGSWAGTVAELSAREERLGRWRLQGPTALRVAAEAFRVDPFYLVGSGGGRLQGAADLTFQPLRGTAQAQWEQLDLALANPWQEAAVLAGSTTGAADLHWLPEEQISIALKTEASGTIEAEGQKIGLRRLVLDTEWDAEGLRGAVDLVLAEGGTLAGTIGSGDPARFGLPASGRGRVDWQAFNLSLLSPWLPELQIAGQSSGNLSGEWAGEGEQLALAGEIEAAGAVRSAELDLQIRRAAVGLDWTADGLQADWQIALGDGGELDGRVSSPAPAGLDPPQRGRLDARCQGLDLAILRPWMPDQMLLEGKLAGELDGEWRDGRQLDLGGQAAIRQGELQWEGEEGVITAALQQAQIDWDWRQESLQGEISLALAEYGRASGRFSLPLPARLPAAMIPDGPVRVELAGNLKEEGLLTALLPGLVQETSGELSFDLRVGGTWQAPELGGEARLAQAGAYLPTAGVRLRDISVLVRLQGEEVRIESLQARSGPGQIEASAVIRLQEWQLLEYTGRLQGQEFQLIDLPELQLLASPDLEIAGSRQKLAVRGEVLLPDVLVRGRGDEPPIAPSEDVVIVDEEVSPDEERPELPVALDIRVRIVLGENVLVKAEGLDARLEGSVRLAVSGLDPDEITAQGDIRVAQGHFSTYGVRLKIERGTVLFAGGPVDRPTLDILALRTAGEVKAGVRVTGTPRQPEVKLYSEPAMPDSDVLAYMILGHPVGEGDGNATLLMTAASALLTRGESAVLQNRVQRMLGLDVLELEAGDGDVTGSQITLGKYLNPDLYISFGQSLFTESNVVRLRYDLSKKWQLESSVGDESAVDLYYKIEFK